MKFISSGIIICGIIMSSMFLSAYKNNEYTLNPERENINYTPQTNPSFMSNSDGLPYFFGFPYYCNPIKYPPNVITSIAACKPFLSQIYPQTKFAQPLKLKP
jgi:hypothetical protein